MDDRKDLQPYLVPVADKLRSLEYVDPPVNLSGRVLGRLPEKRSIPDRVACTLRAAASSRTPSGERHVILPSDPVERGFFLLLTGLFFLVLSLIVLFRIHLGLSMDGYALSLAPACLAALILVKAGWDQLGSPQAIVASRPTLATAFGLFALTALMGGTVPGKHPLDLIALWIGLSGLVTMAGLALIMKLAGNRNPVMRTGSFTAGNSPVTK